jgi:hypothetical protein
VFRLASVPLPDSGTATAEAPAERDYAR